jgi:DNA-binding transcriptional ArsR family regulator
VATKKDLAKLVQKRYDILLQLYRGSELSVSQIAKELQMDDGNISRYIKALVTQGLVKTREATDAPRVTRSGYPMAGGKPRKLCSLTMRVWRIMELYEAEPMMDPTNGQIEELIALIENNNLSTDFRAFVAGKFSDIALEHPDTILENYNIRRLFEKIVTGNFTFDEKIGKALQSALSTSLMQRMLNKETKEWFDKKIRDVLLTKVSDETAEVNFKEWATNTLARAARVSNDQNLLNKTIDKFLEIYFNKGSNSEIVKNELLMFEPKFQKMILERTRTYTHDPTKSSRAEELLTALISLWMSSRLS